MAIRDVVTRGYGPGAPTFLVTRGYGAGVATATESQVGERWSGSVRRRQRSARRLVFLPFLISLLKGQV